MLTCHLNQRFSTLFTKILRAAFVASIGLISQVSFAASPERVSYSVSASNDWVKEVALDLDSLERLNASEQSQHYLLVDRQTKFNLEGSFDTEYYFHYGYLITNVDGLQNGSRKSIEFDPAYENLALHKVSVWREGVEYDRTLSAQYRLLHGEDEREDLVYNGEYTLDFILSDIRVGDVVEYSYSIKGSNPVFADLREFGYKTNWGVPVEQVHYRLLGPSGTKMIQRVKGAAPRFDVSEYKGLTEYQLSLSLVEAVDTQDQARVVLSNVDDWSSIVDWGVPMYTRALADSSGVAGIASEIRSRHNSQEEQIGAALVWVQSQIRYLGLEYGTNSHHPSPAQETLQRRYGDCKDKAVLLIAILYELGIRAEPALVYSGKHAPLTESPYRFHAFNHVIVHLLHNGVSHWLDPTKLYQKGSLGQFAESDHGHALVLKRNQTALTIMAPEVSDGRMEVNKRLVLSTEGAIDLLVSSTRTHEEAEKHRGDLTRKGLSELSKNYFNFYKKSFQGLEPKAVLKVEDRSDNTIITTEQYQFWFDHNEKDKNNDALVGADDIVSALSDIEELNQDDSDLELIGVNISENIEISYPLPIRGESESKQINNAYLNFDYHYKVDEKNRLLKIEYNLAVRKTKIDPADLVRLKNDVEQAQDLLHSYIKYPLEQAEIYRLGALSVKAKEWASVLSISSIVLAIVVYLYAFIEWQLDRRRTKTMGVFYPVSAIKFWLMSFTTVGLFLVFYFYRSFRYSRDKLGKKILPIVRAIFSSLFLYSFYSNLRSYSDRENKEKIVGKVLSALLGVMFLIFSIVGAHYYPMIATMLASLCVFPAVKWVNKLNQDDLKPMIQNSRIRPRHILLAILSPLLFVYTIPGELNILPSSEVVSKWQLWGHQERFFRERNVISDGEDIALFYSSADFDFRLDGNGLTNERIFSYWVEDSGDFEHTAIAYDTIRSVRVESDTPGMPLTGGTIKAVSRHGKELTVWVPRVKNCRTKFILQLRESLPVDAKFNCAI